MGMIEKVEALFRKAADGSVTPAEALLFEAKAEELLVKWSIDRAMLNLTDKKAEEEIILFRMTISNPYRMDKILLIGAVADAFRCVCNYSGENLRIVGFESDIENVKFLYAHLQLQAVGMLIEAEFEDEPTGNLTTYRKNFFLGFTRSVGERLSKFTKDAVSETTGAEVVLYDRAKAVQDEYTRLFPLSGTAHLKRRYSRSYSAGISAGQRADIGITKVGPRGQRAIGG